MNYANLSNLMFRTQWNSQNFYPRDILGIIPRLKNGDVVELYVSHLIDEPDMVSALEYGRCSSTVEEDLGGIGATVEENLDRGGASVDEDLVGATVKEDLGGTSTATAEEDLGGTSIATTSDDPIEHYDWESDSQDSKDSKYGDLLEYDDEYGLEKKRELPK
ncbi:hypothetical protein FXO38_15065 [Capsicum annuum]|nr:hypothetical protein FXO37_24545 [Capsicum annuum]KAF3654599.1 hypothetical protein FXO38_15065 [Capsicum annuum]